MGQTDDVFSIEFNDKRSSSLIPIPREKASLLQLRRAPAGSVQEAVHPLELRPLLNQGGRRAKVRRAARRRREEHQAQVPLQLNDVQNRPEEAHLL